jgi:hypothetical protein
MFEQPPRSPQSPAETEPFVFTAERGFQTVLEQLLKMKQKNEVVQGGSKSFSPQEIAEQIRASIEAVIPLVRAQNNEITKNAITFIRNDFIPYSPEIDLDRLSELNVITRTGNLREVVRESLHQLLNQPMKMNSVFMLDAEFLHLFREITGSEY